jgi:hypothetical protein
MFNKGATIVMNKKPGKPITIDNITQRYEKSSSTTKQRIRRGL